MKVSSRLAHVLLVLLLLVCGGIFYTIHLLSDGVFDVGDGVHHYQLSRYSWQHPELFLHHWGKPFFILLSSPFAQFGYDGIVLFNVLCAVCTAWAAAACVRLLSSRFQATAGLLVLFTPLYLAVSISGLTEPLFGLVLMLSILLVLRKKFLAAALLISFLPFVRSEGFLLLPLFAIVLLIRGRWKLLPLLAAGTVAYSVIGGIYFEDFLWLIHQNPYRGAEEIYGSGPLWHFVPHFKYLLGSAGALCFLAAAAWTAWPYSRKRKENEFIHEEFWLLLGCFFTYFIAHSLFWKFGLFGSLGLHRVMAAISPLAAVVIAVNLQRAISFVPKRFSWIPIVFAALVVTANIVQTFRQDRIPFKVTDEQQPLVDAAKAIKDQKLENELLYAHHPYFTFLLDRDPYDPARTRDLWALKAQRNNLPKGAIIAWDAHFWQETGVSLESLRADPALEQVKEFGSGMVVFRVK